MPNKIDKEARAKYLLAAYRDGIEIHDIAQNLGISDRWVVKQLNALGVYPKNNKQHKLHFELLTLAECDRCKFPDCRWNSNSKYCPMQTWEMKNK